MRLPKSLNLLDVFAIATGAMVSSGLFILPGLAYAKAGPAVVVSYLLAGLLACCGMLSIAELATAMPKAGGDYFFATRGLGPAVGTIAGLLSWFALSLKSVFALVGMGAFAVLVIGIDARLVAFVFCLVFLVLNLTGVKIAARVQVALVAGLLVLLVLYVLWALPAVRMSNFEPVAPKGLTPIVSTAGFVFVSFGGLLKVASVAEEIERPDRNIPMGMIVSLLVVAVAYALVILMTIGVLSPDRLSGSRTPISDGAASFMGSWGAVVMGVAAILAFVSTANAGMMAASRYLLALSRDELLPGPFGRINAKFKTPHIALVVTGLFMAAALVLELDLLIKAASTVLVLSYMLSILSVIIMRESHLQNYRPRFRAPFYPWLQIVGLLGLGLLLREMGGVVLLISIALIVAGFLVYWFYGRPRASHEYALLHVIERIASRELVTGALESELKEIIRERDDIVADRFDHVVEDCVVLDLKGEIAVEKFSRLAADALAPRLDIERETLFKLLLARERETTTALNPNLAIPHVVIEGKHRFDILITRCRDGIFFSETAPSVKTVFVIVGTKDERNFHLRSLAAIAQIVHESDFAKRWIVARGEEALRDLVLLGRRMRNK